MSETLAPRSWNRCKDASEAPGEAILRYPEATVKYVILLLDTEAARNMSEAEGQAW